MINLRRTIPRRLCRLAVATVVLPVLLRSASLFGANAVQTLESGRLTIFVGNNGTFAYDPDRTRLGTAGLYYPGSTFRAIMAGAGVWVAGKQGEEWKVTASGEASEFVPGPIAEGGSPLGSLFPVYKLSRDLPGPLNDDYRNWPISLGAPTTGVGEPLLRGAQSLFTIFNDNDSAAHIFSGFTGTAPLGVEVRLYAYLNDDATQFLDTTFSQIVFFDYEVFNASPDTIDSCIVTIYSDPDIGFSADDRIGSNAALQTVYCYNETISDPIYGEMTPIVGFTFLEPAAASANFYYPCRVAFPECVRIDTLPKVVNLLKGLRPNGLPYFDPETSLITTFPYGGNPADSSGWINELSRDYRMLLNTRAVALPPGEAIRLRAALIVVQGRTIAEGLERYFAVTGQLRGIYAADTTRLQIRTASGEAVTIKGRVPQVNDWGGRFLGGALDFASHYFHRSTIPQLPSDVSVQVMRRPETSALIFAPTGDGDYHLTNVTQTQVRVIREDGVVLKCAFLDNNRDGTPATPNGFLDPILVLSLPEDEATIPQGALLSQYEAEQLYLLDLADTPQRLRGTTFEIDGAVMTTPFVELSSEVSVIEAPADAYRELTLEFTNRSLFLQEVAITSDIPQGIVASPSSFTLGPGGTRRVFLRVFGSLQAGEESGFKIESYSLRDSRYSVTVTVLPESQAVLGDATDDGLLGFGDLLLMVDALYRNAPLYVPLRRLDASCDGKFNLVDLMEFVNLLYLGAPITCESDLP